MGTTSSNLSNGPPDPSNISVDSLSLRRAWNQTIRTRTHVDVAIIGAGIGGLYCASKLGSSKKIIIFESSAEIGGRIRTLKNNIDRGAWRVHDSHARMHTLASELNIELEPTHSSLALKKFNCGNTTKNNPIQGLSTFQSNVVQNDLQKALQNEQSTGYIGLQDGIARTYTVKSVSTDSGADPIFRVPKNGMSEFPVKLRQALPSNVKVHMKTRVTQITLERQQNDSIYWLETRDRNGSKQHWSASSVILNCQLAHLPKTNFEEFLKPVKACVGSRPLTHVYVKTDRDLNPLYNVTCDELGQLITIGPRTLMASYTGGELSKLHFHYWLQDKSRYTSWLQGLVDKHFEKLERPPVKISDPRVFYYEHAVGIWPPNFANKKCMKEVAHPHPVRLPNLYWVNETLSENYQGWAEGSLEVAEYVLACIHETVKPKIFTSIPKNAIVIDGRVLNVESWMASHPGGKMAIWSYLGKDATDMFYGIHSTKSGALALIIPFQIGFMES